jgi:phosphoribosylformimino-5-aminoimidazole carboxamide ribotide isomerase
MIIYPAIDIRGGRCVRLVEGDFARETVFADDPATAAERWAATGAAWLHVVDLDGAVVGEPVNIEAIRRIRQVVKLPIQLGGGLRLLDHVAAAFDHGVDRVILGTAAIRSPELVREAAARWPEQIAVGLDARDGRLAADGWLDQTDALAVDVARELAAAGVLHFVFTDIRRDGTLQGPNLPALREVVDAVPTAEVIASGGIGALGDLLDVAEAGAAGVIIGRALYDGRIDLTTALDAVRITKESA